MKVAIVGVISSVCFAAMLSVVFYLERQAEFGRIENAKPTYTRFDPKTGTYSDYVPEQPKQ